MCLSASLVTAQRDLKAPGFLSPGDSVIYEQSTCSSSLISLVDDEVLHQSPGQGAMRKIGYNEEHYSADNLTLVFSYQKLMSGKGVNLGENPLAIV